MAVAELDMITDVFNRLVNSCHAKCISEKYAEADLNKGEGVCIDRCTAKFFEVSHHSFEVSCPCHDLYIFQASARQRKTRSQSYECLVPSHTHSKLFFRDCPSAPFVSMDNPLHNETEHQISSFSDWACRHLEIAYTEKVTNQSEIQTTTLSFSIFENTKRTVADLDWSPRFQVNKKVGERCACSKLR